MNSEGPFTIVIYETDYHDDLVCDLYGVGLIASNNGDECGMMIVKKSFVDIGPDE